MAVLSGFFCAFPTKNIQKSIELFLRDPDLKSQKQKHKKHYFKSCKGRKKSYNESEDEMAEKDVAEKRFIALNDVFADIKAIYSGL